MKLDKILGKTATILEVIALFILIFKAKSMIVTTANWIEFMAIFTALLIDLVYNKIKWEGIKWEGGKRDVNYNNYQKTKETRWKIATNCTRLQRSKQWIIKSDIWFKHWKQAIKKSTNQRLALSMILQEFVKKGGTNDQ